jgi:AAA+ ATPase superfamily predicted ATPase
MIRERKIARNAGILFLTAMATSLVGGGLVESVITAPDYLHQLYTSRTLASVGVFLEFLNGFAVIGIVVLLYPVLKRYSQGLALGFAVFRMIEALFCFASAFFPLILLAYIQEYPAGNPGVASTVQSLGAHLIAARAQIAGLWIPLFFGLGALLFYYILFQSRLLPRLISVWGIIGVILILILNLLKIESEWGMLLALPIILNEVFMGIWLIVKGFSVI